jgi:iron complex outermembrane recepter protein
MKHALNAILMAGISLLAATTAHAQQTGSAADSAQAADGGDAAKSSDAEITVTGSRVATGANSPTPLTVLPTDQFLKLQPTTVTDALTLMPALMGSQNTGSRPGGGQRNGAAANLSLRNMGDLRTLILMDGQRVIPTINSNNAQVDSSIVPQLLLKRADLVTGGVSAVYGSDGVSGVINFITDRDFNGIKLQANRGVSTYGDAQTWDVGIAAGTRFANDRGHIEFSYQHLDDKGLPDRRNALERDLFRANIGQAGNGSSANPYFNINDMRIANATFGGLVISSSLASMVGQQFTSPTALGAFNHGLVPLVGGTLVPFGSAGTLASTNVESGGDGAYYASSSIKHKSSFDQAFGRIDYDLTDDVHFYAQFSYSSLTNANQFRSPNFISNNTTGNLRFNFRNPYMWNLANVGPSIRSNLTGTMGMNILILNAPRSQNETEAWMAQTGFEGKIGDKFDWNIGFSKQRSQLTSIDPFRGVCLRWRQARST